MTGTSTGPEFYATSFKDFNDMGLEGAAKEVLVEGLRAHPQSQLLLDLATKEGVEVPKLPAQQPKLWEAPQPAAPQPAAPQPVYQWRPPPRPNTCLQRDWGLASVQALRRAQAAHVAFAEADSASWAEQRLGNTEAIAAEERRLREAVVECFHACKVELRQKNLEFRTEHCRAPSRPDVHTKVEDAVRRLGPEEALRELCLVEAPGAFAQESLWQEEGPVSYLNLARKMSEYDAPFERSRYLACAGPGSTHEMLGAIAQETATRVQAMQRGSARVLVLGGHGASAVSAARAGAAEVVVLEKRRFVAAAAREVLRRNLTAEQAARCSVRESFDGGCWDLAVVELWHGTGGMAWGPLEVLASAAAAARPGNWRNVIPSRVTVRVELADGRLAEQSGFDLSRMDARFRGLSLPPLRVGLPDGEGSLPGPGAHPTAFRPKPLTEAVVAFELDLSDAAGTLRELAGKAVPLRPRALCAGCATAAVVSMELHLGAQGAGPQAQVRFAQWLAGGVRVSEGTEVAGFAARCGAGRIWLDWDWSSTVEPPFGYGSLSEWYFEMLRDAARHDLYDAALQAEIAKVRGAMGKCRVLDVGSGDGILSMMALRAGASAAVGVEVVTPIARVSEEVVAANRQPCDGRQAPIPPEDKAPLDIWCTDVRGVSEPPDDMKFDVLVSELMDASGLGENLVQLTKSARRRLCVPGAPVIPARLKLFGVLCEVKLPDLNGVNMDAFWPFWPLERMSDSLWLTVDVDKGEGDFRFLTKPVEMLDLELGVADVEDIPTRRELKFEGTEAGTANIVLWWFETQLSATDPSIVLTNAPNRFDSRHAATCWGQAMAELRVPLQVGLGQNAEVTMEMPFGEYQLRFKPRAEPSPEAAAVPSYLRPPPTAKPYSSEYCSDMEAFKTYKKEVDLATRSNKVGHTALRNADVAAKCALERCAQCLASQSWHFGLEVSTAIRMASGWYAVGGEGRM